MSEYCREQHPLLCEEGSEEEQYSRHYFRRRPMTQKRSKDSLKGAATIIGRWPGHWSSFLTYWWIGLGMISITTFVIYNSLFAFSIPSAGLTILDHMSTKNIDRSTSASALMDVFMHIFAISYKEVDLKNYIPDIKLLSKKYTGFKYHLIVVINDTEYESNVDWLNAHKNNQKALNLLLANNKDNKSSKKGMQQSRFEVQCITLTTYMNSSPLVKYWKDMPSKLVEFLARSVAVWDRGGIAFNPNILIDKRQRSLYLEKLHNLFDKYSSRITSNKDTGTNKKTTTKSSTTTEIKGKKRHNNIRDIINELERDNEAANRFSEQNLVEAENIILPSVIRGARHVPTISQKAKNDRQEKNELQYEIHLLPDSEKSFEQNHSKLEYHLNDNNTKENNINTYNTTSLGFLPLFLQYLFENRAKAEEARTWKRNIVETPNNEQSDTNLGNQVSNDNLNPVIVEPPKTFDKLEKFMSHDPSVEYYDMNSEKNRLTIDLKGNIIATDTPCHAFLGTIFSNSFHHSEQETITDFLITELTFFCKGVLSSCVGLEILLL